MEINTLDQLIFYCKDKNRVCPQPKLWNSMYEKLKCTKRLSNGGWEPPIPLILGAWWYTSEREKQFRLEEHLKWADTHGQLKEISDYLTSLTEEQWVHMDDLKN